ncbi:LPD38 domain-containing protein [Brevundimonas diminuta]|uniref:LPD38 domain-containing protein n=1 Tax=Brevundimonas diminuta TaxID=293 RepID=UPI003F80F0C1
MTDRQAAMAEAYRRGIMKPEQKVAYEEAMRRGLVQGPERTLGQRFLDNLEDGFQRSGVGNILRSADPGGDGLLNLRDLTKVREGSPAAWLLDRTAGRDREWFATDAAVPGVGKVLSGRALEGTVRAQRERERRQLYESKAEADPISNPADFAAFLSGQIVGGGVSPENWIGGGAGRGLPLARRLATGAAEQALVAGAVDVSLQLGDMGAGVQDEYSGLQTAGAAALGAGLSTAIDAARPVSRFVRDAFTAKVEPVGATTQQASPTVAPNSPEISSVAQETPTVAGVEVGAQNPPSAAPSASAAALTAAEAPVALPEFGIVQRVERKSPFRDLVGKAKAGETPQVVGEWLGRAYTALISDHHPLIRAVDSLRSQTEELTGTPVDLLPSQDPRKLARGRFDWAAIGHQDLLHGVHDYGGLEPKTPALADVISAVSVRAKRAGEKAEDALQRFNEYMVARRSSLEWDRHARGELENAPVARSKDQAEAFIAHMEKMHPEFRELSDAVNLYSQGLLKKAFDGGLIDQATYNASLANRDFYVPLRRVLDDDPATGGKGGGKNATAEVKAFKGSERDIVDPISVLIERTYRLNQRLRQNDLNNAFIRLGERLEAAKRTAGITDGENGWLRKVDTPRKPIKVSREEIAAQSKARPDLVEQMFDDDGIEVWRPGEINDAGRPILYSWRNGKRQAWEIVDETWGRDVFEAMAGMSKGMQDTFLNAMAAPTAVLSQTITRDPAFLLSNFIRDQVSSWIVTDVGFVPGEGLRGIADELMQTDATRLYGISGGISGGAATAMLGDALHKADTLALAQKGIKAKYFSSLSGLLATSEISETGTRLQVFKRAFDRAKKEGFSEYDALIEASFTARDMIDFGRAGSKMHMTRRLVTFLNAYAQGLDKALRVLGADGAMTRVPLKDALRPLFSMEVAPGQMRAEDRAALQLAGRAWTKVAAVATFGAAITALFHDDPDWQQSNEKTRATHWTIPWGGNLVKVPKPFELAFLSNIVERGIEATAGRDSQAWEKMWRGLGMIFAPPTDIPVAAVAGGLASNTNSLTGRPIVPDHLQNLPPELQYQHWNSSFSQWLGATLNVSPAKIDYAIQGFAGPFGSYALRGMDASDPDRAEGSWTDLPVVRRFVNPSYRGSQDKRDFYDRAGAKSSELRRALNGMKEYEERGRPDAAQAIFADLDEPGKLFVTSQLGATPTRRLHPLERARVFAQESSRIIGELNGAEPKDQGIPLPPMSRQTRRMVGDAIERITVAELRNAMIATRQPGFENRKLMDRAGYWQDLRDLAPEVAAELERRLGVGQDRAYDYEAVMMIWPQVEQRLKAEGSTAYLDDLAADAQGRTQSWGERLEIEGPEAMEFRF